MIVATVAIPRTKMEEEPKDALEIAEDDTLPKLDVVDDEPGKMVAEEEGKALNEKWLDHVKELSEPVGVQNLTLMEPMKLRHHDEVVKVASKLYCRYRAMGVAPLKIHTDREATFLSQHFQAWCRKMVAWQTMTGGDEGPSNGRIESEVQQVKRRLRMLVRESGLGERFWPDIARYVGRERLQSQLQTLGVPTKPLLPIGSKVTVKTKRWHRIGQVPPFITMTLMGPSPLMVAGHVCMEGSQLQNSKLVIKTNPGADRAVMELVEVYPAKPSKRMWSKQPPRSHFRSRTPSATSTS